MHETYKKPRGKFFNPPPEPQDTDSLKISLDSLAERMNSGIGKLEKKIIKKYFSPPNESKKRQVNI
ncbi:hypothetical protein ACFL7D_01940 [candidate division KSB1 bacterium]